MTDNENVEFDVTDFAPDEIQELLTALGAELSPEQAELLARFVTEAGSVEAAIETLNQLRSTDRAA